MFAPRVITITGPKFATVRFGRDRVREQQERRRVPSRGAPARARRASSVVSTATAGFARVNHGPARVRADHGGVHGRAVEALREPSDDGRDLARE